MNSEEYLNKFSFQHFTPSRKDILFFLTSIRNKCSKTMTYLYGKGIHGIISSWLRSFLSPVASDPEKSCDSDCSSIVYMNITLFNTDAITAFKIGILQLDLFYGLCE